MGEGGGQGWGRGKNEFALQGQLSYPTLHEWKGTGWVVLKSVKQLPAKLLYVGHLHLNEK